ncbi:hypothetical protein [Pseudomonas sp. GZD-209]|uniref:hypothetical protein n=1 Tax=Pseudomonas sp. GZD-209 TaxID=3404807 RepID=UPI003BB5DE16
MAKTPLRDSTESTSSSDAPVDHVAPASPELTGGAGYTYEDGVVAVYAAALLAETTAPGLPGRTVKKVSVQQGPLGHPLDDLIVEAQGVDELRVLLSLQVKRKLTISKAKSNTDFRETIHRAYRTVGGTNFRVGIDKVGAIADEIVDANKRNFETLCEWARATADTESFVTKVMTEGVAGDKKKFYLIVKGLIEELQIEQDLDHASHRLLSNFVLMRFEMLHEGSTTEAAAVANLANFLSPSEHHRADDLWRRLLALVRVSEGVAASLDRKTIVSRLNGSFRLKAAPSLQAALSRVAAESKLAATEINNTIAGVSIPRERFVLMSHAALKSSSFVQIGGLPGAGKSVVLRYLVEEALKIGPALFLKADRLTGASWAQYSSATGIGGGALEDLLVELAAAGTATLYVDGIDRVELGSRGVILDILHTIIDSPLLATWKVVVSVRDTGMEPIRTWLPSSIFDRGAQLIDVNGFDDNEAKILATAKPALRPMLFSDDQVKQIVRRPFFAGVLMQRSTADAGQPGSEVELATAWWEKGGYGAVTARAGKRRSALVQLAHAGANQLGRRIPSLGIDPEALAELEADGIIRQVRTGQTVGFVHDIYFEWAFLQYLISKGERWLEVIREVGEPPVLGRVVELLSQSELQYGEDWKTYLLQLEATTGVRAQWLRSWLVGPFGIPAFPAHETTCNDVLLGNEGKLLSKLVVWYQAERTKANPTPLNAELFPNLELSKRLMFADALAWPSDFDAWHRFCLWLLKNINDIPTSIRSDVVSVFEVWQNALAEIPNTVSEAIVSLAEGWLREIEGRRHSRNRQKDNDLWGKLSYGEVDELESRLRTILLRSSKSYPELVTSYISKWETTDDIPDNVSSAIFLFASSLSQVCPAQLVSFTLQALLKPLPEEVVRRSRQSRYGLGFGLDGLAGQKLSINDRKFFPAAPTREPFHSLFRNAPDAAKQLVRQLANHAIEAWRQLHRLGHTKQGTPIPLSLDFPWGMQAFWGGENQYAWTWNSSGSPAVASGLMALEAWAFEQLKAVRAPDEIIHEVLEGHECVAAVSIAVAVALETQLCSSTSLPLLASQRLWMWDIKRNVSAWGLGTNLMGFQSPDEAHYNAIKAMNERKWIKYELRALASLCVLRGGETGKRLSEAITAFPTALPFDYEEEREDKISVAQLLRTAEIWAEIGKLENYSAVPTEDGSQILIKHDNPKATGPDIDAINRHQTELSEHWSLILWVDKYFENKQLGTLSVEEAIKRARQLDHPSLFDTAQDYVSGEFQRQGAVAGVAAVALAYGSLNDSECEWAVSVCARACSTPETVNGFYRGSRLLHHPVLYSARALGALLLNPSLRVEAQERLIWLAAHPYQQIGIEAISAMMRVGEPHPEIAWLALHLASTLSMIQRHIYGGDSEVAARSEKEQLTAAVQLIIQKMEQPQQAPTAPPAMPAAWVRLSKPKVRSAKRPRRIGGLAQTTALKWELPSVEPDTDWLAKVLAQAPVSVFIATEMRADFLAWCDSLVLWTVERLHPAWLSEAEPQEFEATGSDLYEWRRILFGFLARVALHLEPEEGYRRFVEPAAATDDETFCSLMAEFVSHLTCNLMDEPTIPAPTLPLLELIVTRMLECSDWERATWNDGKLYNSDLSQMIRSIFFIEVESASGATRFANGDWSDLGKVLELTDPVLLRYGPLPQITSAFLTSCERGLSAYPIEYFVKHLISVLDRKEGMPLGWRGTMLPARLAGLIQRVSERTQPMPLPVAQALLRGLDKLVDLGDRRAAAVQTSEVFKDVRTGI